MSETGHNTKIYTEQGGSVQVIESGGILDIKTGAAILTNGANVSHIADAVASNAHTKLNAVLVVLENLGILATS